MVAGGAGAGAGAGASAAAAGMLVSVGPVVQLHRLRSWGSTDLVVFEPVRPKRIGKSD